MSNRLGYGWGTGYANSARLRTYRVMVETVSAELSITGPSELALYEKTWTMLHRQAAFGDSARELINAALVKCRGTAR